MANKIITDSADNRKYFLHYHVFEGNNDYIIQASLFNDCGNLISRNKITVSKNYNINISNLIDIFMKNNILPPDLSDQILTN